MSDVLSIWTVYDHPTDWPAHYVARRFDVLVDGRLAVSAQVHVSNDLEQLRAVLERMGVPARAIRLLDDNVWNTTDEMRLVARELGAGGTGGVILVTSKTHSRRVRATWSAVVGPSPRATVRYASDEPFDDGRWWRNTRDALDVSREVFGLMNVWAGFPVQPDRGQR